MTSSNQEPPQNQILPLINLFTQGLFHDVLNEIAGMQKIFPNSVLLYNISGSVHTELRQFDLAIDNYKKALVIKPDYADAFCNIGIVQHKIGELDESILSYKKAIEFNPLHAVAYQNLGDALKDQGKLEESVEVYNKALAIKPDYVEAYNNLGNTLKDQGKLEESVEVYNKALAIKPDYVEAYNNMGNALNEQGKLEEAIEAYNKALLIKPDYADAYNNVGNALKEQGKLEQAIEAYKKALAIKPDSAKVYNNLGNVLKDQSKLDEAIEAYNRALAIKPYYVEAWLNGAEALEKWNKLEKLGLWLEKAFQILEPIPSEISFMKSKLLWRNRDMQGAIKLISNVDFETIAPILRCDYLNLKAKCFEASNNFDLAFDCFESMNVLAKKSADYLRHDTKQYFQNIKDQLAILKSIPVKKSAINTTEETELVPVFLVGFPRSGTTLLDTILRSHSAINVAEEQPNLQSAKTFIQKSGYTDWVGTVLPQEIIFGAQKAYINELDKHRHSIDNKSVFIDKLPLNLLETPLIQQLYPKAKFILALRHPVDTILSCWMQNFKLNSAMANMVDLDRVAEFYCVTMETFKICRAKYNLSVHEIRYEDLLENLYSETSLLLKFLDLDWEDQMENYQETALKRGRINTPSYSQVIQPIYKDAKYRWLKYEKHLRQYITQLEPWINEFYYSKH